MPHKHIVCHINSRTTRHEGSIGLHPQVLHAHMYSLFSFLSCAGTGRCCKLVLSRSHLIDQMCCRAQQLPLMRKSFRMTVSCQSVSQRCCTPSDHQGTLTTLSRWFSDRHLMQSRHLLQTSKVAMLLILPHTLSIYLSVAFCTESGAAWAPSMLLYEPCCSTWQL